MLRAFLALLMLSMMPTLSLAQTRVLDLTASPPTSAPSRSEPQVVEVETPLVIGLSPGTTWTRAPLRLEVRSFDRLVYRYGERFVVRILIRNTGDDLLTLPWSPVVDSVVLAPDESLLSIGLALHGEADNGPMTSTTRAAFPKPTT
jgi:hypothetical protein